MSKHSITVTLVGGRRVTIDLRDVVELEPLTPAEVGHVCPECLSGLSREMPDGSRECAECGQLSMASEWGLA